jgi:ribose 5-phosphate isomerase B
MTKQSIYIGADHAGWEMKEHLKEFLGEDGYEIVDMGNQNLVEEDDYPDFSYAVAKRVVTDESARGIVICGNAQGVCIVANKVKGVRAVTGFDTDVAKSAREDDNSNILCLPARHINKKTAKEIVETWLHTEFSKADRHIRRLKKVERIENQEFDSSE